MSGDPPNPPLNIGSNLKIHWMPPVAEEETPSRASWQVSETSHHPNLPENPFVTPPYDDIRSEPVTGPSKEHHQETDPQSYTGGRYALEALDLAFPGSVEPKKPYGDPQDFANTYISRALAQGMGIKDIAEELKAITQGLKEYAKANGLEPGQKESVVDERVEGEVQEVSDTTHARLQQVNELAELFGQQLQDLKEKVDNDKLDMIQFLTDKFNDKLHQKEDSKKVEMEKSREEVQRLRDDTRTIKAETMELKESSKENNRKIQEELNELGAFGMKEINGLKGDVKASREQEAMLRGILGEMHEGQKKMAMGLGALAILPWMVWLGSKAGKRIAEWLGIGKDKEKGNKEKGKGGKEATATRRHHPRDFIVAIDP